MTRKHRRMRVDPVKIECRPLKNFGVINILTFEGCRRIQNSTTFDKVVVPPTARIAQSSLALLYHDCGSRAPMFMSSFVRTVNRLTIC